MGKLIKLAIVALVLHAAWRVGSSYWQFYAFEDQVREMALTSGTQPEDVLHDRVVSIASEAGIPLLPEDVTVRKQPGHVIVTAAYTDQVQILPRYPYPWRHTLDLSVYSLR
jgi:hypothetical protein